MGKKRTVELQKDMTEAWGWYKNAKRSMDATAEAFKEFTLAMERVEKDLKELKDSEVTQTLMITEETDE